MKKKFVQSKKTNLLIDLDPFLSLRYKDFSYFDERELLHAANIALDSGAQGVMLHLQKTDLQDRRRMKLYQEFIQVRPGKVVLFAELEAQVMKKIRQLKPDMVLLYRKGSKKDPYRQLGKIKENEKTLIEKIQSVGTELCFFIKADSDQVAEAYYYGADSVMLDCASLALSSEKAKTRLLQKMHECKQISSALDLHFYLGRGLQLEQIRELHADGFVLGHSLLQKSILFGLKTVLKK